MSDRIVSFLADLGGTAAMSLRILLKSKFLKGNTVDNSRRNLMILGNGPSLLTTIKDYDRKFGDYDLMAVNFAANTPEFCRLRPNRYVLADPHFFDGSDDANVARLWDNLAAVAWDMTLHLPAPCLHHKRVERALADNPRLRVRAFNMVATGGFRAVRHAAMRHRMAMPRPRNVMIPAIMEGVAAGYRSIYVAGADHTWTRTLSVDDDNRVVSIQPHFYADNNAETSRVASVYEGVRLHEVLQSMTIAFRSYWEIREYADEIGVKIINITPGSMIDAFPRESSR